MDELAMAGGMELLKWLRLIGRGRATGYRWIGRGWVTTCNIGGKLYITSEEIQRRFWQRAKNGEFAQEAGGIIAVQREEEEPERKRRKNKKEKPKGEADAEEPQDDAGDDNDGDDETE